MAHTVKQLEKMAGERWRTCDGTCRFDSGWNTQFDSGRPPLFTTTPTIAHHPNVPPAAS